MIDDRVHLIFSNLYLLHLGLLIALEDNFITDVLLSEVAWHRSPQLNPAKPVWAHTQVPFAFIPQLLHGLLLIMALAKEGLHVVVHQSHSDVHFSRMQIGWRRNGIVSLQNQTHGQSYGEDV